MTAKSTVVFAETGSGCGRGDGQEMGNGYNVECGSDGEELGSAYHVECWRNGEELGSGYDVESEEARSRCSGGCGRVGGVQ